MQPGDAKNRLAFLEEAPRRNNVRYGVFRCLCGVEKEICVYPVFVGKVKSCGCLQKEKIIKRSTKHGYATKGISKTYYCWYAMIDRCHNKKNFAYKNYGARGIKVCSRWRKDIRNFVKDMGEWPDKKTGLSIERINNDGDYKPSNCRWATRKEQRLNQRKSKRYHYFKIKGEEYTIAELARKFNINYQTLYARLIRYNFPIEKAIYYAQNN